MMIINWTDKVWTWSKADREGEVGHDWPAGPWDDEPDKVVWIDPVTGLDCLIHRNRMGGLCGYVGIGPEHPFSGIAYGGCATRADCEGGWTDDESHVSPERVLEVHGGITFSSFCVEDPRGEAHGICHVAEPGRSERVWWFGFDCGHFMDVMPGMLALERGMGFSAPLDGAYRDILFVKEQIELLATQLKEYT